MIGSGWIALTLVTLFILTLRYWDRLEAWWNKTIPYEIDSEMKEDWSRGKQVTFMEPVPSPVVKVASRSIHDSLAMANADPSAYWLGPRDRATGLRPIQTPGRGIRNLAGYD